MEKQYTDKNFIVRTAARAEGNMRLVANGDRTLTRKYRSIANHYNRSGQCNSDPCFSAAPLKKERHRTVNNYQIVRL